MASGFQVGDRRSGQMSSSSSVAPEPALPPALCVPSLLQLLLDSQLPEELLKLTGCVSSVPVVP